MRLRMWRIIYLLVKRWRRKIFDQFQMSDQSKKILVFLKKRGICEIYEQGFLIKIGKYKITQNSKIIELLNRIEKLKWFKTIFPQGKHYDNQCLLTYEEKYVILEWICYLRYKKLYKLADYLKKRLVRTGTYWWFPQEKITIENMNGYGELEMKFLAGRSWDEKDDFLKPFLKKQDKIEDKTLVCIKGHNWHSISDKRSISHRLTFLCSVIDEKSKKVCRILEFHPQVGMF